MGRGEYEAEKAKRSLESLNRQLMIQRTTHKRFLDQEGDLERKVRFAVKAGNRREAKEHLAEKRRVAAKSQRSRDLCDFLERTIDSVTDASSVRETLGLLTEIRTTFKGADLDDMYSQLGDVTSNIADFNQTVSDAQGILSEPYVQVASRGGASGGLDDEGLERELEEYLGGFAGDTTPEPPRQVPIGDRGATPVELPRGAQPHTAGFGANPARYSESGLFDVDPQLQYA